MSATISPCGAYRYTLTRQTVGHAAELSRACLWIMLNPSTADASLDDPTIRRCRGFSQSIGCDEFTVINLFAYRATSPQNLLAGGQIRLGAVGPENDLHTVEQLHRHRGCPIICAWGAHPAARVRATQLAPLLNHCGVQALQVTQGGSPCHPLYLPASLRPIPYKVSP